MKTYAIRPLKTARPRWPEPFGRPFAPTEVTTGKEPAPPDFGNDFLILNPRPDLIAPPPPPRDLDFFNIDFP